MRFAHCVFHCSGTAITFNATDRNVDMMLVFEFSIFTHTDFFSVGGWSKTLWGNLALHILHNRFSSHHNMIYVHDDADFGHGMQSVLRIVNNSFSGNGTALFLHSDNVIVQHTDDNEYPNGPSFHCRVGHDSYLNIANAALSGVLISVADLPTACFVRIRATTIHYFELRVVNFANFVLHMHSTTVVLPSRVDFAMAPRGNVSMTGGTRLLGRWDVMSHGSTVHWRVDGSLSKGFDITGSTTRWVWHTSDTDFNGHLDAYSFVSCPCAHVDFSLVIERVRLITTIPYAVNFGANATYTRFKFSAIDNQLFDISNGFFVHDEAIFGPTSYWHIHGNTYHGAGYVIYFNNPNIQINHGPTNRYLDGHVHCHVANSGEDFWLVESTVRNLTLLLANTPKVFVHLCDVHYVWIFVIERAQYEIDFFGTVVHLPSRFDSEASPYGWVRIHGGCSFHGPWWLNSRGSTVRWWAQDSLTNGFVINGSTFHWVFVIHRVTAGGGNNAIDFRPSATHTNLAFDATNCTLRNNAAHFVYVWHSVIFVGGTFGVRGCDFGTISNVFEWDKSTLCNPPTTVITWEHNIYLGSGYIIYVNVSNVRINHRDNNRYGNGSFVARIGHGSEPFWIVNSTVVETQVYLSHDPTVCLSGSTIEKIVVTVIDPDCRYNVTIKQTTVRGSSYWKLGSSIKGNVAITDNAVLEDVWYLNSIGSTVRWYTEYVRCAGFVINGRTNNWNMTSVGTHFIGPYIAYHFVKCDCVHKNLVLNTLNIYVAPHILYVVYFDDGTSYDNLQLTARDCDFHTVTNIIVAHVNALFITRSYWTCDALRYRGQGYIIYGQQPNLQISHTHSNVYGGGRIHCRVGHDAPTFYLWNSAINSINLITGDKYQRVNIWEVVIVTVIVHQINCDNCAFFANRTHVLGTTQVYVRGGRNCTYEYEGSHFDGRYSAGTDIEISNRTDAIVHRSSDTIFHGGVNTYGPLFRWEIIFIGCTFIGKGFALGQCGRSSSIISVPLRFAFAAIPKPRRQAKPAAKWGLPSLVFSDNAAALRPPPPSFLR